MKTNQLKKTIHPGWQEIKLANIFEFKNGLNKEKGFFGHGTPIVNYMDVNGGGGLYFENIVGKVEVNKSELDRFDVRKGDVFFTRTSETLDEIGFSAVALDDFKNTVFSGFVLRARPKGKLLMPSYAQYCFRTQNARQEIKEKSSYTTRALTSGSLLNHVNLLLPPLPEQMRIVLVLETWDKSIAKLSQKIQVKKQVKKGLMQNLLTGKKRFSAFTEKWKLIEIGNLCDIKRGGSPRPIQDYMTEDMEGLNWLKIGDVPRGSRYIYKTSGRIKKEGLNKTTVVNEGDFILSNSMSFGRPYIMKTKACIHDGWLALKDISKDVNKDFLYYLLSSEMVQAKFRSISAGSGVLNLKKETVAEVVLRIPSLLEQNQIAQLLTATDDEIDKLELKLNILESQKRYLLNNLTTGTIRTPETLSAKITA